MVYFKNGVGSYKGTIILGNSIACFNLNSTIDNPPIYLPLTFAILQFEISSFLHFVVLFHVASLFSTGVDNIKVGVGIEKALELTNSTVFHRGRQ